MATINDCPTYQVDYEDGTRHGSYKTKEHAEEVAERLKKKGHTVVIKRAIAGFKDVSRKDIP